MLDIVNLEVYKVLCHSIFLKKNLNNVVLASKPKIIIFIKVCYLFTLMPSNAMAIIIIIIIIITSTSSPILTRMCYMQRWCI